MAGFVKLYGTILTSSVWVESHETLRVWVTMLVLADRNGYVAGTPPGIASMARVTLPECQAALAVLTGPDAHSRTKENGGRRIETTEGGWNILNHAKYREMRSEQQIATAERVKKFRAANDESGYVYYAADDEQIKVGFSKNPWARVDEFRTARPNVKLIALERGDKTLERQRQEEFGRTDFTNNKRGAEWFERTAAIDAFVASLVFVVPDVTHQKTEDIVQSSSSSSSSSAVEVLLSAVPNREAWQGIIDMACDGARGAEFKATPTQLETAALEYIAGNHHMTEPSPKHFLAFMRRAVAGEGSPAPSHKRPSNAEKATAALDSIPVRP